MSSGIALARAVGGDADEILLWPLGGLAYAEPRPAVADLCHRGGRAVGQRIDLPGDRRPLYAMGHFSVSWMNPLLAFGGGRPYMDLETFQLITPTHVVGWLFWFFNVSFALLFFNLLPIYPLDGGQMLFSILWPPLGYRRAMKFACITGIIGGGFGLMMGLLTNSGMLLFLAISGITTCYQRLRILKMSAEVEEEPYDLSAAWDEPEGRTGTAAPKKKKVKKRGWRRHGSVRLKTRRSRRALMQSSPR